MKKFSDMLDAVLDIALKVALIFVILFGFILAIIALPKIAKADEKYPVWYRVTSSTLNVRLGPGTEYEAFYQLTRGEEVQGEVKEGSWVAVNCYGFRGFVYADYVQDKRQPATNSGGTYLGRFWITGYNPWCSHCCSGTGLTASGRQAVVGRTVAMAGVPFGTRIYIEGLGSYVVEDRGVGPGVIDVACSSDSACMRITGHYNVYLE